MQAIEEGCGRCQADGALSVEDCGRVEMTAGDER